MHGDTMSKSEPCFAGITSLLWKHRTSFIVGVLSTKLIIWKTNPTLCFFVASLYFSDPLFKLAFFFSSIYE
jgi:hypothetical protein